MKLSDAIRLGAMLHPPGKGGRMDGETRCALASAADAVGIPATWDNVQGQWIVPYVPLQKRFPLLDVIREGAARSYDGSPRPVLHEIWMLNDTEHWSREQIADWVAIVEAAHPDPDPEAEPEPGPDEDEEPVRYDVPPVRIPVPDPED